VFSGEKWSVWLEFARDFKEFKKSLNIRKVNCRPIEKVKDKKRNIYFSIILIVLAIGTYFFVYN